MPSAKGAIRDGEDCGLGGVSASGSTVTPVAEAWAMHSQAGRSAP
jgi:hypothetical protein